MNTTRIILPITAALGLMAAVGCSSVNSRSQEKSYVFNSLTPGTKQRLSEGEIRIGDSPDMVYIALGEPDEKREKVTADAKEAHWIYASYSPEIEQGNVVGYRRVERRSGLLGERYTVQYVPVTETVYHQRQDEKFVVTFKDNRVTEIETSI